jgi:uncharacterized protein (TIGR02996 family)
VRNAELEAAILERPDDEAAYLVYADWLIERGDKLGEWIARSCRGATARDIYEARRDELFGPVADSLDFLDGLVWSHGFLRAVRVSMPEERDSSMSALGAPLPLDDVLARVFEAPAARFLRELRVGIVRRLNNRYADVCAAITRAAPPALEELVLGDFDLGQASLDASDCHTRKMWPAIPRLRKLTLRSGRIAIPAIDLPRLRELEIVANRLEAPSLAAIATASWPELERLQLSTGPRGADGARYEWADLAPIVDGALFPRLTHLGLPACDLGDEIAEALPSSTALPRLRSIDLSWSGLTDRGVEALAARASSFRHLESLRVGGCQIGAEGYAALRSMGVDVSAGQRSFAGVRCAFFSWAAVR